MDIAVNLKFVKEKIIKAALKTKRDPDKITLVAVSKGVGLLEVKEAYALGIRDFGENRVQDAEEKINCSSINVNWHFIGHLQTNKVKNVLPKFSLIHSLDRLRLAKKINQLAQGEGKRIKALVQVNIAEEETKHGLPPLEVKDFLEEVAQFPNLDIIGLMAMAPYVSNPEEVRPYFRRMYSIFRTLDVPGVDMRYLSMGMSNDFTVAVEEGANVLRIGSQLFQGDE